ncbi:hypothetical protein ACWA1F_02670 [Flavobacterium sp. 3-218]
MQIKLNSSKLDFAIDNKKIFQNLFDFNLGSAITEILDINTSLENKAFYLLYNVTKITNTQLSKKLDQKKLDTAVDLVVIFQNLEYEWKKYFEEEITLTKDFFENILQYSPKYLTSSFTLFEKYLKILDIQIPYNFCYDYYLVFRENLYKEFENNKEKYVDLVSFFNNPVYDQNDKLGNQINHYLYIKKFYTNTLQSNIGEAKEALKDLYIEPNFTIYRQNVSGRIYGSDQFINPKTAIDVHSFFNDFFLEGKQFPQFKENYNMIFVLGQPGQGKTSFCYRLIYDVLEKSFGLPSTPLYFIKIRDLNARDFIDKTFDTINEAISQNIDFNNDCCNLILDGLDEAYMSGGLSNLDLKNLYGRLNKTTKYNRKFKIILTSRLNYLDVNDPSVDETLVIKLDDLSDQKISQYVKKFKNFYPENILINKIKLILTKPEFIHIKELIQQPVLMYFIALSNIDIKENDNKSNIYSKIFDSLAERSWDNNGQLHYIKPELKKDSKKYSKYLRQYIRNIAFEIFQSPNLYISIKKLHELEATKQFIEKCLNNDITNESKRIKEISKYLLISFYFQNSNKTHDEDTAIEFFHNSLWEFLTAEYIWEEIKRIVLNADEDGDLKAITIEEYFNILKKMIGNKNINKEIVNNLQNIITNDNFDIQAKVMKQTENVFYKLIEKDILLTYDWRNEQLTAKEKSKEIFDLMWVLFYSLTDSLKFRVKTTSKLNELIFAIDSTLDYYKEIKNIEFREYCFISQFFSGFKINNLIFKMKGHVVLHLKDNKIENTLFKMYHLNAKIHGNSFENVTFKNINLSDAKFLNNKFVDCKFLNVQFDNKSLFDEILESNEFDSKFSKTHKLFTRTESLDDEIISYYILDEIKD